jgi:hypothetical protein
VGYNVPLDFLDQAGDVGFLKTDTWCRDAVTFDVREDMFVMRISAGQLGDIGMLKGIVPRDLLASLIDLVTVLDDPSSIKINELPHIQHHVALKGHLALSLARAGPMVASTRVERWMEG